jgi:hypothetical protein
MKWRKLGRIFCPNPETEWMHSHAANPVADQVGDHLIRIYFSTRDTANRSSVAWVEVDMRLPNRVVRMAKMPTLSPGLVGSFDDSGCSIGSIIRKGKQRLMYYMGWNLGVTVPWRNSIGLAVSENAGETFERISLAPLLDRSNTDPYTLSYPWVLRNEGEWHMWYGSNLRWGKTQADMFHMIKHATSCDGYEWKRDGQVAIQPSDSTEYAFARPCVIKDIQRYRMWYGYRGSAYRIGYAESVDGLSWNRKDDEVGIAPSPGEWDGESIEYPSVLDHDGQRYLLYCGDGYGKTGFGIAMLEQQ